MNISLSPNVRESGLRNLWSSQFACGIRNPGLWNSEYSSRNLESPLSLEFRNPTSTDKDLESNTWNPNPRHQIQNLRLSWIPLHQSEFCRHWTKHTSGGSREGARGGAPLIFRPNWGPKGRKKFLWRLPAPYLRVWMTAPPPPYLKVWTPTAYRLINKIGTCAFAIKDSL